MVLCSSAIKLNRKKVIKFLAHFFFFVFILTDRMCNITLESRSFMLGAHECTRTEHIVVWTNIILGIYFRIVTINRSFNYYEYNRSKKKV